MSKLYLAWLVFFWGSLARADNWVNECNDRLKHLNKDAFVYEQYELPKKVEKVGYQNIEIGPLFIPVPTRIWKSSKLSVIEEHEELTVSLSDKTGFKLVVLKSSVEEMDFFPGFLVNIDGHDRHLFSNISESELISSSLTLDINSIACEPNNKIEAEKLLFIFEFLKPKVRERYSRALRREVFVPKDQGKTYATFTEFKDRFSASFWHYRNEAGGGKSVYEVIYMWPKSVKYGNRISQLVTLKENVKKDSQ